MKCLYQLKLTFYRHWFYIISELAMCSPVFGRNVAHCNMIPMYENYSRIICFPATGTGLEDRCALLSDDLKHKNPSGDSLVVPHLPGHSYVLLPSSKDDQCTLAYYDDVPSWLTNFNFRAELPLAKVDIVFVNYILIHIPGSCWSRKFLLTFEFFGYSFSFYKHW